jgi:hypothetical protein
MSLSLLVKHFRTPRRSVLCLGTALLLVWALPPLLAHSPALNRLAGLCLGGRLNSALHIGRASLGWFSPVVLHDIELRDGTSRCLASVAEVMSERCLLNLLLHPAELGTIHIRRPLLEVTFTGRASDLDPFLDAGAEAATHDGISMAYSRPLPQVRLEIADAGVTIADADREQGWQFHSLQATLSFHADAGRSLHVRVQGAVAGAATNATFKIAARLQHLGHPSLQAEINGTFDGFPLASAAVVAHRFGSKTDLEGTLDGHCRFLVALQDGKPRVQILGGAAVP